jgi:catechol 2,3-dioxygenase-like lactoylglutathione lyase family enzyme
MNRMIGKLQLIAFDAPDIERLATFYTALADLKPVAAQAEDDWITLATSTGQQIAFQLAPDHTPPRWPDPAYPQQMHVDWRVGDMAAEVARAESLGATRLPGGGETWTVLADPAGHPFCLCQGDAGMPVTLADVAIDCADGTALAGFYAEVLGMKVIYEGPEGAAISSDDGTVMFQNVPTYTPPRWPDPAFPQQAHLDIEVSDLDEGERAVLALGATRLPSSDEGWRVFADPAGHPFCLVD